MPGNISYIESSWLGQHLLNMKSNSSNFSVMLHLDKASVLCFYTSYVKDVFWSTSKN